MDLVTGELGRAWHRCMGLVHGVVHGMVMVGVLGLHKLCGILPGWWGCWIGEVEPEHATPKPPPSPCQYFILVVVRCRRWWCFVEIDNTNKYYTITKTCYLSQQTNLTST